MITGQTPALRPPDRAWFGTLSSPAGPATARVRIGPLAVEFSGLPGPVAATMGAAWGPFLAPAGSGGDALRVEVLDCAVDYFIAPAFARAPESYRIVTELEGPVFRTVSYRLASWIDAGRRIGQVALGRGDLDPAPRALENFLRSTIAWLALDTGGFLLHGAGIVRGGRAFLFYGASGAGKSTLAAMSREGRVLSDDLTVIARGEAGLLAVGGPFRGTYTGGAHVVGSFPVAGFFRLRKSDVTRVAPDDGGCFADLVGNLPFVVDKLPHAPGLIDRVREAVGGVPLAYLHFRKDAPFWPAIDAAARP